MFLIVSLVTTTFAWLSLATVNTLSGIELNAVAGYDLEVSLDGVDYYDNLQVSKYLTNIKLDDITSQDGITFTKYGDDKEIVANVDYISLTFHFRTTSNRYTEVHLYNHQKNVGYNENAFGTYITSEGRSFKSDYDFYYSEHELIKAGDVNTYYAKDAMRVAFNSSDLDNPKIFDLSENPLRGFGYEFGAINYYNAKEGVLLTPPNNGPDVITEMSEMVEGTPKALNDTSYLLSLEKNGEYYMGSIKVNIWLEGWDGDAFDAILYDKLKIQFEFIAVML